MISLTEKSPVHYTGPSRIFESRNAPDSQEGCKAGGQWFQNESTSNQEQTSSQRCGLEGMVVLEGGKEPWEVEVWNERWEGMTWSVTRRKRHKRRAERRGGMTGRKGRGRRAIYSERKGDRSTPAGWGEGWTEEHSSRVGAARLSRSKNGSCRQRMASAY